MISKIKLEQFKNIFTNKEGYSYAVSNLGRVVKYTNSIYEGKLMNGGIINGFKVVSIKSSLFSETFYVHKKVATLFIKNNKKTFIYCLHKDGNKLNNKVTNVYWADSVLYATFIKKHPSTKANAIARKGNGYKVDAKAKARLFKVLASKNRPSIAEVAAQFNITPTHLYRLKADI